MRRLTFWLGIAGPLLFIFLSGKAASSTQGFDQMKDPGSNLSAMQFGWLQNLAFVVGGVGFLLLATSMYLSAKQKTKAGPLLVGFFGAVLVLEAIFQSNPYQADFATGIHILLFVLGVIAMIASTVVFGWALRKVGTIISSYSILTAAACLIGFLGIFLTQGRTGFWQMIAVGPLVLWVEVMGVYTYIKSTKLSSKV